MAHSRNPRHMARLTAVILLLGIGLRAHAGDDHPEWERVRVSTGVEIMMSDGINLATDVYAPADDGTYPAILVRTPYNRRYQDETGKFFASNGYVTVIQDVRGRYDSEGTFVMGAFEKSDGLETLEWITRQPWSDGRVGMWGPSYLSYCALLMAEEHPPALKAIVNESGITNMYEFTYLDGALNQTMMATWLGAVVDRRTQRSFTGLNVKPMFHVVPLRELDDMMMDYQGGGWHTVVAHPTDDLYHRTLSVNDSYETLAVPVLHITGWNDWMYSMTIDAFRRMSNRALSQRLIVGPWTHNQPLSGETSFGDEEFGPGAALGFEKEWALCLEWFDYHVKGIDNGVMAKPRVRYFVMNDNVWVTDSVFPPAGSQKAVYYLTSRNGANSSNGDGRLQTAAPTRDGADRFTYDPLDPVPTAGGINCHLVRGLYGIRDQSEVEKRADVLVYTSDPLEDDLQIVGDVTATLFVSSDATDTDFTAKLCEIRKDGYVRIIEDGLAKTRFRNSFAAPEPIVSGEVYELDILVGTTAITIPAGNRLRLEISSSSFPKYPRNPNTGEFEADATRFTRAEQTIHHSPRYPSQIEIPVMK